MRGRGGAVGALLLATALAGAEPGRHLNYAESTNRLVYAFVFGSRDTCHVIRRERPPDRPFAELQRRPPPDGFRGGTGEHFLAALPLGMRPVHIHPTDDARHLLTFANRSILGGPPEEDSVRWVEEEGRRETLDYEGFPFDEEPAWPAIARELPVAPGGREPAEAALNYAFLVRQLGPGRLVVARQTEGEEGLPRERLCFLVTIEGARVALPSEADCKPLLDDAEELFRAGAAWALGAHGSREAAALLRAMPLKGSPPLLRAGIARALARCGDASGRATLLSLLREEKEPAARRAAAWALAALPPDHREADALAALLGDDDAVACLHARRALARLGSGALAALTRASRSSQAELRRDAALTLGRIDDPAAEARLLVLLRDPDDLVRTAAAVALTDPPRSILPENHEAFAQGMDACRKGASGKALRRLCTLAAHAELRHEAVLKALVDAAAAEPKAIASLQHLTGETRSSPAEWAAWWRARSSGR
ncbi:MAG: HEAT repeat domain-containing protein [Planctomycetaceae bacterium]